LGGVAVGGRLGDVGDAVLQLLFQHQGEEAARDLVANVPASPTRLPVDILIKDDHRFQTYDERC
jgi:hypothetical protein